MLLNFDWKETSTCFLSLSLDQKAFLIEDLLVFFQKLDEISILLRYVLFLWHSIQLIRMDESSQMYTIDRKQKKFQLLINDFKRFYKILYWKFVPFLLLSAFDSFSFWNKQTSGNWLYNIASTNDNNNNDVKQLKRKKMFGSIRTYRTSLTLFLL